VLAWAWLGDRRVFDDPKLTHTRLCIRGSLAGAPVKRPVYAPNPPLPKRFELAPTPRDTDPTLPSLEFVERDLHALSRSGVVRWSGRLGNSGERRELPLHEFVEGKFNWDKARLDGPVPGHVWHALRTERATILRLLPPRMPRPPRLWLLPAPPKRLSLSAPQLSPAPAPQPSPMPAPQQPSLTPKMPLSLPQLICLAKQYYGNCVATGQRRSIAAFARANEVPWKRAERAWLAAGLPVPQHGGARR
jgi:hypothetical protein